MKTVPEVRSRKYPIKGQHSQCSFPILYSNKVREDGITRNSSHTKDNIDLSFTLFYSSSTSYWYGDALPICNGRSGNIQGLWWVVTSWKLFLIQLANIFYFYFMISAAKLQSQLARKPPLTRNILQKCRTKSYSTHQSNLQQPTNKVRMP